VHLRIVDHDVQSQSLHRQSADRCQQCVRRDDAIVSRGHQSHARIHQFLPDPRLFANTAERNFGGVDLRRGCLDLALAASSCRQLCTTVARA